MARKGRYREIVVSQLEKLLSGNDKIKIKSPDYLIDKITGQRREVDISLKGYVGYHKILIVIECRQRKHTDDATWIEQLGKKKEDLLIDKLIAVSSSNFTKPAIKKAKSYNIELRVIKDIDISLTNDWINSVSFEQIKYNFAFENLNIGFLTNEYNGIIDPKKLQKPTILYKSQINYSDKIIILREKDKPDLKVSFTDFIFLINEYTNNSIYNDVKKNGDKIFKNINFYFYDNSSLIYMKIKNKFYRIYYFYTSGYYWSVSQYISIKNAVQYIQNDFIIAERIEYSVYIDKKEFIFAIQKDIKNKHKNAIFFIK